MTAAAQHAAPAPSNGTMLLTLVVRHPETHAPVALVAGSEVPEWAVELVHPDDIAGGDPKRAAKPSAPAK